MAVARMSSGPVVIAVAQINCTVGDLAGNAQRIARAARLAREAGAQVLLTPELSLCGYPPEDLLLREDFHQSCDAALTRLACELSALGDLHVLVGHPLAREGRHFNACSVLAGGIVAGTYCKHDLPNYAVFDERRYFQPDNRPLVFELGGTRFGVNICEDAWYGYAPGCAAAAGAQVLLVPNASPFHLGKSELRRTTLREHVSGAGLALVYANFVGGQDELVFDGASFALDRLGQPCLLAPAFAETLSFVEALGGDLRPSGIGPIELAPANGGNASGALAQGAATVSGAWAPAALPQDAPAEAQAYAALCLGLRDYVSKNGFPGALIGLSGGVDSALVLALAHDALGAGRVRAVMMPSEYTADISLADARALAGTLGVRYDVLPIAPVFSAFNASLADQFAGLAWDTTEENLQARIRGSLLMALSNKIGSIVLTTGNKSETAVGYCTLYGDMAGGFAVIKDLTKSLVYRLCRYRNELSAVIPERILERAPSAELRPNQTDQDSLPPYDLVDAVIERYMEQGQSVAQIVAAGHPEADVLRVVRLIRLNEYKRRQAPVGIRITHRAFGRDWRYPITNRFRDADPQAA
jgi:NAD+ synthase (glutamine-hydrolysing)